MKIIVGLGNPGKKYSRSRHNIGFAAIDHYVKNINGTFTEKSQLQSLVSDSQINNEKIIFIKPLTFMNKSGEAVGKTMRYYQVPLDDILVLHDDTALALNTIRLRVNGGSGGHNGIASIIGSCGKDFWRLRIGIGPPPENYDLSDYVLGRFKKEEMKALSPVLEVVDSTINEFINGDSEPKTIAINSESL